MRTDAGLADRIALASILVVAAIALAPAWQPVWYQDDQLPSAFRTAHTDLARHRGVLFPRMAFELGFGYGQLLYQVYAPLGFELSAWLHAWGLGYLTALRVYFSLCLVGAALGAYGYGRAVLGGRAGPVLAATAYVLAPPVLLDAHPGGDFGESLGIALLPWALWAFHALLLRPNWTSFGAAALSVAAMNLAHNITALFFTGLVCIYAGLLALRAASTTRAGTDGAPAQVGLRAAQFALGRAGGAIVLGLAVAAIYWLPALVEMPYSRIGEQRRGTFDVTDYLLPLHEVVQHTPIFSYHLDEQHRFGLLPFLLATSAIGLLVAAVMRRRDGHGAARPDLLVLAGCGAVFAVVLALQLRVSEPVWETVPLIGFAQFPRRLHIFSSMAAATLVGSIPWSLGQLGVRPDRRWLVVTLAIAACMLAGLPGVYRPEPVAASHRITEDQVSIGSSADERFSQRSAYDDFLPIWVTERQLDIPKRPARPEPYQRASVRPAPEVEILERSYHRVRLTATAREPSAIVLHTFYFPGWRATLDGQALAVEPVGPLGLTGVTVPEGRHEVVITFGETPLRQAAMAVSIVGVAVLIAVFAAGIGTMHALRWTGAIAAIVVAPWLVHVTAFSEPLPALSPLDLEVGPSARLVGTERVERIYHPGERVEVTALWQATAWTALDLRSGLQLVPMEGGRVLVERWARPNYARTPTAKWVRGEIVPDALAVVIPHDTPAGRYQVRAGLRSSASQTVVPIGEIAVVRGDGHR